MYSPKGLETCCKILYNLLALRGLNELSFVSLLHLSNSWNLVFIIIRSSCGHLFGSSQCGYPRNNISSRLTKQLSFDNLMEAFHYRCLISTVKGFCTLSKIALRLASQVPVFLRSLILFHFMNYLCFTKVEQFRKIVNLGNKSQCDFRQKYWQLFIWVEMKNALTTLICHRIRASCFIQSTKKRGIA